MNKKIIVTLILAMILGSMIVFASLSVFNTKDKVSSVLASNGISGYDISQIVCGLETCDPVRITIPNVIDKFYVPKPYKCLEQDEETLECIDKYYYTNQELLDQRNNWESTTIKLAEDYLKEQEEAKSEKVVGTEVTIKGK